MTGKKPHQLLILPIQYLPGKKNPDIDHLRVLFSDPGMDVIRSESGEVAGTLARYPRNRIVIGFPAMNEGLVDIGLIRSLQPCGKIIVFMPDTTVLKSSPASGCSRCYGRWQEEGKSIFVDTLRQADAFIAATPGDKALLSRRFEDIPAMTVEQLRRGKKIAFRRRDESVSIIMLTRNILSDTRRCLKSLDQYTARNFELIIIDNGSNDGTVPYLKTLKQKQPRLRLIFNDKNTGFAQACNQGIRIARGNYLLLLNNDVLLSEGWLDRMIACAQSHPSVGVVGPCTNAAVGEQVVPVSFGADEREVQRFAARHVLRNPGRWFETNRITGFCMLIKKEVIMNVGLLDERFGPGGYEDFDYCFRVRQAGYRIMVAGDTFVYHVGGKSYPANNLDCIGLKRQNARILAEKWCTKALDIMERLPKGL